MVAGAAVPASWPVPAAVLRARPARRAEAGRDGAPGQQGAPEQPVEASRRSDLPRNAALAAAWQEGSRHFVGVLAPGAGVVAPLCRQPFRPVPTGLRWKRTVDLPPAVRLSGYGGSVAASGGDVEVSCPRSGLVARWRLSAGECRWQTPLPLAEACALAPGRHGGAGWALRAGAPSPADGTPTIERWPLADAIRLDNHWAAIGPA